MTRLGLTAPWISSVALLFTLVGGIIKYEVRDYCRWEEFNATCPEDHVIMINTARYGRMQRERCLERDYYIGCSGDVLLQTDARCSGRHHCTIKVPDETLHEVQPCPKDILAYLEAGYSCLPVATGQGQMCQGRQPILLQANQGYIGSVITEDKGIGTGYCPWRVQVRPGQRVNLTLYDFAILRYDQDSLLCQVFANIKEKTKAKDLPLCAGAVRTRHIMISDTNTVDIQVVNHGIKTRPYFILKYEAVGCPNLPAPRGGWARRTGDSVVVGCNGTTLRWHLVCRGTEWVGHVKNCTSDGKSAWALGQVIVGDGSFPYGLLISVAIGVILGVILGSALLTGVLVCRKRRLKEAENAHAQALLKEAAPPPPPGGQRGERIYAPAMEKQLSQGGSYIYELRHNSVQNADPTGVGPIPLEPQRPGARKPNMSDMSESGHGRTYPYGRSRDHVYESPKMMRREDDIFHANDVPYYHEFDPSLSGGPEPRADCGRRMEDLHAGLPGRGNIQSSVSLNDD